MKINKRSMLITTIGPASENIIKDLFKAGMTTVRLNFSHGDHEEQGARIKTTKELRKELNVPISILLDTKGPEIRVGKFINGMQHFKRDQKVTIYTDSDSYKNKECSTGEMTVAYDMSKDLSVGKPILVDDGKLELTVVDIEPGIIHALSKNEHIVKTNKRVNLPGTKFSMPFLAEKDITDIKYAADNKLDYIAASFVNTAEDIMQIKNILKEKKAEDIQIIAKIESQYAVDHFDDILEATDAVMIARGDLGLEIPYYEVPVAEKMMIRKCREVGKPVIVATQMLDSMESNPHPTRAEVTDVYLATELGADATMLSGESAAGDYPVKAVEVMSTINHRAEDEFYNKTYYNSYIEGLKDSSTKRGKIAKLVTLKARKGEYKFAVVLSRTGQLLKEVAKYRPDTNILGLVSDKRQVTKFGIVHSVFVETNVTLFDEVKKNKEAAHKIVQHYGGLKGDKFLVVENDKISEFTL